MQSSGLDEEAEAIQSECGDSLPSLGDVASELGDPSQLRVPSAVCTSQMAAAAWPKRDDLKLGFFDREETEGSSVSDGASAAAAASRVSTGPAAPEVGEHRPDPALQQAIRDSISKIVAVLRPLQTAVSTPATAATPAAAPVEQPQKLRSAEAEAAASAKPISVDGDGWDDLDVDVDPDALAEAAAASHSSAAIASMSSLSLNSEESLFRGMPERRNAAVIDAWRSSPHVASLIAAGQIESAMRELNRQLAISNFVEMRDTLILAAMTSNFAMPYGVDAPKPQLVPLVSVNPVTQASVPSSAITLQSVQSRQQELFAACSENDMDRVQNAVRAIFTRAPLCSVSDGNESRAILQAVRTAGAYGVLRLLELKRRQAATVREQCEMSLLMSVLPGIHPAHRVLTYRMALKLCFTNKLYASCIPICRKLLDLHARGAVDASSVDVPKVRAVLTQCERANTDEFSVTVFAEVCLLFSLVLALIFVGSLHLRILLFALARFVHCVVKPCSSASIVTRHTRHPIKNSFATCVI